ncbi:SH3 domains protein 2 Carom [Triplophysa tibetana]|uniref:SH3 domains protein 2 Carom n=1 Tax=Triplophysa tibetana TaxID=1572043 RepID=A0A5A9P061_9TELE|nr:SH3 domains protein 2 Carom [Triplophysa tibetana]
MQPPPRKVKVSQELRNTHIDQISRLHLKHQTECDLLEDMRTYSQKKATLERDYAQFVVPNACSQYQQMPGEGAELSDLYQTAPSQVAMVTMSVTLCRNTSFHYARLLS